MAVFKVLTAPDKALKQISKKVDKVDSSTQKFMDDMLETMYHDNGVGLAAIQVGNPLQILVLDLQDDSDHEELGYEVTYPLYIINPEIIFSSEEHNIATEGCLSVPGIRCDIPRPSEVKCKYLDYYGKEQEIYAKGWLARAIQHEIDHFQGKLIIDYMSSFKKNIALEKLSKLKRKNNAEY